MSIKIKAMILMFTVVISTAALSGYFAFSANQAILDSAMQRDLKLVLQLMESSVDEQAAKAAARASIVSSLPSIKEAFRAQDRDQLTQRLLPAMLVQREQFGVREAQFHLPPAISFLRLLNPSEVSSEDQSSFRPMLVAANRQQQAFRGTVLGRAGLSIRAVYPVADSQGHIGSFEIGMDFASILQVIKETTGFEAAVLVDDGMLREIATLLPRPDDDRLVGGYQAVDATNWALLKPLLNPERLKTIREPTTRVISINGTAWGAVAIPLADFKGDRIGVMVAARDFEHFETQRNWAMVRSAAMAGLQVLLLAGVLMLVINGMLLRPLNALNRLADNTPEEQPGERENLLTRRDEIGKLAQRLAPALVASDKEPGHD